jgi:hypothetical protein
LAQQLGSDGYQNQAERAQLGAVVRLQLSFEQDVRDCQFMGRSKSGFGDVSAFEVDQD